MSTPNLFRYATKELSQDAFICWLLAWANKDFEGDELHQVGVRFLESLLAKNNLDSIEINSFEIKPQYEKIDVLVLVNTTLKTLKDKPEDSLAIIIEDKVGAGLTGNQLERYYKTIENLGFNKDQILRIYLRTKDKLDLSAIEKYGYKPFMRDEFLEVLKPYKGKNQILLDFRDFWQQIENDTNSFLETPKKLWNNQTWIGLYKALRNDKQTGLNEGDIGRKNLLNQNSTPTLGRLFVQKKKDCDFFVHLCGENVNFSIHVRENNPDTVKVLRKKWLSALVNMDVGDGNKIMRAKRIGKNTKMIIGYVKGYVMHENEIVDVAKTIANLRKIQHLMLNLEID